MSFTTDLANARRLGIEANATLIAERKAATVSLDQRAFAARLRAYRKRHPLKESKTMSTATLPRTVTLHERINTSGRVDTSVGIIYGVKVVGLKSSNLRTYTSAALQGAIPLYEGCHVCVGHPDSRDADTNRHVGSVIGTLKNVASRPDGLYADLHYLKAHPLAATIVESAEHHPHLFGLSHNAEGVTEQHGKEMVVTKILTVRSVDIVCNPATTTGLFESAARRRGPVVPRGPRALAAALRGESYERLMEAEDLGPDGLPIDPERRAEEPEAEKADPLMDAAALATLKEIKKAMAGSDSPTEKILAVCELARRFKRASDAQGDDVSLVNTVTNKPIAESHVPQGAEALANAIR